MGGVFIALMGYEMGYLLDTFFFTKYYLWKGRRLVIVWNYFSGAIKLWTWFVGSVSIHLMLNAAQHIQFAEANVDDDDGSSKISVMGKEHLVDSSEI